jgi:hypothetical protein
MTNVETLIARIMNLPIAPPAAKTHDTHHQIR